MRTRRFWRPLLSTFCTITCPTWAVEATWVPPSACTSRPTMSTTLISGMSSGGRASWVRTRSGMARASLAGQDPCDDLAVGGDLRVHRVLQRLLEAGRHLRQVEVHPRLAGLHVAAGHQRAEVAEHRPAEDVQAGMGAHQAGAAFVVDRAAHAGAGRRDRVAGRGDQVEVVALAGVHDPGLHALPDQHAVVRRLAAAAGIERRPVEHDAGLRIRRIRPDDRAVPLPDARIGPVQAVGVPMLFEAHPGSLGRRRRVLGFHRGPDALRQADGLQRGQRPARSARRPGCRSASRRPGWC